jgi:DNA-nicking Smr family endonuclease
MRRRAKRLTDEDRILWSRVARSAVPLKGRSYPEEPAPPPAPNGFSEPDQTAFEHLAEPAVPSPMPKKKDQAVRKLDEPTRDKLAKGRLEITGRIDLHGLTQDEAYMLLLSFMRRAYESGQRYVLVITGKGSRGEGVLRRAVPQWFSTAPFRGMVGSFEDAARHHGGHGALYVRLRKKGVM